MPTDSTVGSVELKEEFIGDAINLDLFATLADGTAFAITALQGGAVVGITNTTDDSVTDIGGAIIWAALGGTLIFETRIQANVITTMGMNAGFSDAQNEALLPAQLGGTTFTSTATTAAVWVFDTAATNDVWHAFTVDDDNDTGTAIATLNSGVVPVAGEYQTLRVVLADQGSGGTAMADALFYIDGKLYHREESAIDRAALLCPYVGFQNKSGVAHQVTLDYIHVTGPRAAA